MLFCAEKEWLTQVFLFFYMGTYLYNSSLPFVRTNFNGNRIWNGRFTNFPYPDPEPSLGKVIRWKLSANPQKKEKQEESFQLAVASQPALPEEDNYLLWLGHSSFFIRLHGVNILTDPVLGNLSLIKRKAPLPIPVSALQGIDYVLISHAHRDHFDVSSLKQLYKQNPRMVVLGPLKLQYLLSKIAPAVLHQEAGWYQQYETHKAVNISFLPAIHWHRRGITDLNEVLWGSFMIESTKTKERIYFAGDTAYGKHFRDIQDAVGKMRTCLMPVGAYKPHWLMKGSHMSPTEALKAFSDLKGETFIPMHYGTFDLSDEPLGEPYRMLNERKEQFTTGRELRLLQPGEPFDIAK